MVGIIFLKGLLLGISIAAPVGPMCVLCLQRTLNYGRASGFFTGLGIVVADVLYAMLALFGVSFIANLSAGHENAIRIWAGLFVSGLGLKTLFSKPKTAPVNQKHSTLIKDFLSGFVLAFINPMILLFFMAILAGLNFSVAQNGFTASSLLILGVGLGSALWWFVVTSGLHFLSKKFKTLPFKLINRISGTLILLFGVLALTSLFFD